MACPRKFAVHSKRIRHGGQLSNLTTTKVEIHAGLESLGRPHIQSFDHMIKCGLNSIVAEMTPLQFSLATGDKVCLKVSDIHIAHPSAPLDSFETKPKNVFPSECRQRRETYSGNCSVKLQWAVNGSEESSVQIDLGEVPVMVKSELCNLSEFTTEELIQHSEHEHNWGGYFIIKGYEKIIRMLQMTRRNFPIAIKRSSWRSRGLFFSDLGILIRAVRSDEFSCNNVLHYIKNGSAKFMFSQQKVLYYVPVFLLLRALTKNTDEEIYFDLTRSYCANEYYLECVKSMIREVHKQGIQTQIECKNYIGVLFRSRFPELPPWISNESVTDFILNNRILVHLNTHEEKYHLILFMIHKLFSCAQGIHQVEQIDSLMMQEVLVGGYLYQKVLAERIETWLLNLKNVILKKFNVCSEVFNSTTLKLCARQIGNISRFMETFMATGNISSRSGLGLMQNSGLVIMAENINKMRYMSHFRAIHRGSYFTTMRTTDARQLLPDAWGFICPVHTPDGVPCGLLNHLAKDCEISCSPDFQHIKKIHKMLVESGMISVKVKLENLGSKLYVVMLEGNILGYVKIDDVFNLIGKLREAKVSGVVPTMMEIVFISFTERGQYPGLFLFVGPARMMRPVKNVALNKVEFIGTFEQVYMNIIIDNKPAYNTLPTHMELHKTSFLSNLANLIPMPDCNQSPRNMYQCQMSKQTMGTPCHNFQQQAETKLYRLQTPATPLFRPRHYDNIHLDEYASGVNAIVAVISYTGYDMEDAMIINKAADERGFASGSIYKSHFIELEGNNYFARDPNDIDLMNFLDYDGLPPVGTRLKYKCIFYCYFDLEERTFKQVKNQEKEDAYVDSIRYLGNFTYNSARKICITIRISRNTNIGDKFASCAGQKGICSRKYPTEDFPFTESGIVPDIVFNPHGFPSRMTIAMIIEAMAGKSAALNGFVHDATPFQFTEKYTAVNYMARCLEASGYNHYGTECMYSGLDGTQIRADIYLGIVSYQRLRHMVNDKWQVRATGPVDAITHQPVKGRKRGGGVRFGEMERDALISHGAAFLLQDRLFYGSDKISLLICKECGTILGPIRRVTKQSECGLLRTPVLCQLCHNGSNISSIEIPFALKYLLTELASVNINAFFKVSLI